MACTIGYFVNNKISFGKEGIRLLYIFPFICATIQCYLQTRVFIHESPKYLMQAGQLKEVKSH